MQNRFKVKEVPVTDIIFVEKNARFMNQATFQQLVSNLKRDGQLSSVPFTILHTKGKDKGKYEVISGNHRVKAAMAAGLTNIIVLYAEDTSITNDEKRAIQISHNSIEGEDDLMILKELVDEITSVDMREYANIDESMFAELDGMDYDIVQPTNEVVPVTFTFFDTNKVDFDRLVETLDDMTDEEIESMHILPKKSLAKFNTVVGKVQTKYKIKSMGLGILKMVEIVNAMMDNDEDKVEDNGSK